ncbi:MAG: hypothetical protein H6740_10160 [Alphaproteobacteria bacterium]|nr:hypothetical protein [Alphaproteobacteria bacterium]
MLMIHFLTACLLQPTKLTDSATPSGTDSGNMGVEGGDSADTGQVVEELPDPCALDDGARLPLGDEGDYLAQGADLTGSRARCAGVWHATAGAVDSTLEISLPEWTGDATARLEVTNLLGEVVAEATGLTAGGSLTATLPYSGEVLLRLEPDDPDAEANDYALHVDCVGGCDTAWTRYPVVLMHGMGGTDSFVGLFNYFIGVKDDLGGLGYSVVTPAVDAFSPPEDRAAQWAVHLDELMAQGVGRRFNLIGHSQGGVDARYLATALGYAPHIASITTLATPHHGSAAADLLAGTIDITAIGRWVVDGAMELFTQIFGLGEADFTESILRLSPEEMERFNELVPDSEGVRYFSWSGRTCSVLDFECQGLTNGEVVDLHFLPTFTVIEWIEGPNDGLVSVSSAEWGEVRGEMPADHLNQIGFFSDTTPFDHLQFFRDELAHLSAEGL